jgi:hypothetical protein
MRPSVVDYTPNSRQLKQPFATGRPARLLARLIRVFA